MKKLLLASYFLTFFINTFSQSRPFVGLEGLEDQKGNEYYEWAGYSVLIKKNAKKPQKAKDISKLKKEFDIKGAHQEYSLPEITKTNTVVYALDSLGGGKDPVLNIHKIFYIFDKNDKRSDIICFQKLGERDTIIENTVVRLFLEEQLSSYKVSSTVKSIDFVGRQIVLGDMCKWMSPHNIHCMGGQISWSVFDSSDKAKRDNEQHILRNQIDKNNFILDDNLISVVFEGEPIYARRIVYKSLRSPNGYPLIVYYIAKELEGQYISCIMSHYGYGRNDYELPELLKEVMYFEELPSDARNIYDYPQKEILDTEEQDNIEEQSGYSKYDVFLIPFKLGVYNPLGKQKEFVGTSTYLSLGFNVSFKYTGKSSSSLLLDMGFVIPNDRQVFIYSEDGYNYETKTSSIVNINVGLDHVRKLRRNLYWNVTFKVGCSFLQTDILDKELDDGSKTYKEATTLSLTAGTGLRFKRVCAFVEYQFAPYRMSKHVSAGGNSAIMAGLGFVF